MNTLVWSTWADLVRDQKNLPWSAQISSDIWYIYNDKQKEASFYLYQNDMIVGPQF